MRFVFALLLLTWLGQGVNGAMLCGLLGMVFQTGLAFLFLKDLWAVKPEPLPPGFHKEIGKYALPMIVSSVVTMCLNNLDLILVRRFCPGDEAGLYATAAILGRIAFYGPAVLVSVLFTEAATAKALEEKLAPMKAQLARLSAESGSPGAREVIGGLGWIVGLIGLAAWFKRPGASRRD